MFAVLELDDKVRSVLVIDALECITDFKAEMVILDPRLHTLIAFKFPRFAGLPPAIVDAMIDMRFLGVLTGFAREPGCRIRRAPDGVFPVIIR